MAHSKEEEVTRDFICMEDYDLALVVCDAVCLERNLNLALQVMDVSPNTLLAINLVDEAMKKGIKIDDKKLSTKLDTPVIKIAARSGFNMENLKEIIYEMTLTKREKNVTLMCENKGKLATEKYLKKAEELAKKVITYTKSDYQKRDLKIDQILTSKRTRNSHYDFAFITHFLADDSVFKLPVNSIIFFVCQT